MALLVSLAATSCTPTVGDDEPGDEPPDVTPGSGGRTGSGGRPAISGGSGGTAAPAGGMGGTVAASGRDGGAPIGGMGMAGAPGIGGNTQPPIPTPADDLLTRRIKLTPGRGFYDSPIMVTVTVDDSNNVIRYTTNGQKPSPTVGTVYNGPIPIKETTALRVAAFTKDGQVASYSEAATYIFLDDVIKQSADKRPPPGWPATWGKNVVDYGMDPRVVTDPRYVNTIKNDLKSIPTMAIVMHLPDLFDNTTGIYANADRRGDAWERPASLELIRPDGKPGFQINAGIRIRGGFSRSKDNPKHAFRMYFKKQYGDGKLKYPVFEGPLTEYDNFDLRCPQNYSWHFQNDGRGIFVRDQFARDNQLAMGQNSERGDFYHLYINGIYWGVFNTAERPGAKYAAAYWGGAETDYDVVKVGPSMDYSIYATDGDLMAWTRLYNLIRNNPGDDSLFWRVQGRNASGARDMAVEHLLDMDNLIDYQLLQAWGGNFDAPVSRFLGEQKPNNIYMIRNKTAGSTGFKFIAHDSEHTMNLTDAPGIMINRLGPFPAGEMDIKKSSSQNMFQKFFNSNEFKLRVADRYYKHWFNGGAMTVPRLVERYNARVKEVDRAIVAESARWGDSKRTATQRPFTRDDNWLPEVNKVRNEWIMKRNDVFHGQIMMKGFWPTTPAPTYSQHGGEIARNGRVMINVPAGATVFYTTDGSDPRAPGGANGAKAQMYGGAGITIAADTTVKARAKIGDAWSPLNEVSFTVK